MVTLKTYTQEEVLNILHTVHARIGELDPSGTSAIISDAMNIAYEMIAEIRQEE